MRHRATCATQYECGINFVRTASFRNRKCAAFYEYIGMGPWFQQLKLRDALESDATPMTIFLR